MSDEIAVVALGARSYLRNAARQLLEVLDRLAEHEIAAAGYTREEIAALERLAAMPIDGLPFGSWPQ